MQYKEACFKTQPQQGNSGKFLRIRESTEVHYDDPVFTAARFLPSVFS